MTKRTKLIITIAIIDNKTPSFYIKRFHMQMHADEDTFYIIDGYGFIFRAFYALPNLTSRTTGEPIGAVYGFFKMLISIINSAKPSHLAIALDTGKRTFRNDDYDKYVENARLEKLLKKTRCNWILQV